MLLIGITCVAALTGCGEEFSDPTINAVLPQRGAVGAEVDILGDRFVGRGQDRFVSFGGLQARILLWEAQRVRAYVPSGLLGLTVVVVTVDGQPSNAVSFVVE